MRRTFYVVALIAVIAVALVAYRRATETIVIERAMLNGPPPEASRTILNLVGERLPFIPHSVQDKMRNRVVVVNVWATWCRPCRDEMPRLENEIAKAHPNDVLVIAISGERPTTVREYNHGARLSFPLVADPGGRLVRSYGANAPIPRTFVADRTGIVRYQHIGYGPRSFEELKSVVERLTQGAPL
jgi:peroxiredoxin